MEKIAKRTRTKGATMVYMRRVIPRVRVQRDEQSADTEYDRYTPMHLYTLNPIDHWFGWMPLHQLKPLGMQLVMARLLAVAKQSKYWEGDFYQGPYICPVLGADGSYAIAWKQKNNGWSFLCTPHKVPFFSNELDPIDVDRVAVPRWLDRDEFLESYARDGSDDRYYSF